LRQKIGIFSYKTSNEKEGERGKGKGERVRNIEL
jgi:hypothetical protein